MDHYCKHCHETREPEVTYEFKDGEETTWKHCRECGSDRVVPVDEIADGNIGEDR